MLNAVYYTALFGWGRIAAGSKFLLTTSSCWQVAFRTGWACKLSRGSYLFECPPLFFIQVTADWVLCKILRLEKFQRENGSFVWTCLCVPSSACTSPEVVVNEWNQASCRKPVNPCVPLLTQRSQVRAAVQGCPRSEQYGLGVPSCSLQTGACSNTCTGSEVSFLICSD